MSVLNMMERMTPYVIAGEKMPVDKMDLADHLCWQLNQLDPAADAARHQIMSELFGTVHSDTFIKGGFHCDYGFNIHFQGYAWVNYNCSILDTSPVTIGAGAFIAPQVVFACSAHPLLATQRVDEGLMTSAPITLADNVWIGAGSVIMGGVTIGTGSIIGAGSVVNKDIPAGVVAMGSPCKVYRKVTEADRINLKK